MKNFNAEVKLEYGIDLGRIYFDENIDRNKAYGFDYFFIDYGNYKKPESIDDILEITDNKAKEKIIKSEKAEDYDFEHWTCMDILEEFYTGKVDEIVDALDRADISYKKLYKTVVTKGYSQGDYAEVFIPKAYIDSFDEKIINDNGLPNFLQEYIDNLFWDSPIFIEIDIYPTKANDIHFENCELHEVVPDYFNYPYDIDNCKEDIKKFLNDRFKHAAAKDAIIEAVLDVFPNEVKYVY